MPRRGNRCFSGRTSRAIGRGAHASLGALASGQDCTHAEDGAPPGRGAAFEGIGECAVLQKEAFGIDFRDDANGITPASCRMRSLIMSASREAVSANLDRGSSGGPDPVARCSPVVVRICASRMIVSDRMRSTRTVSLD